MSTILSLRQVNSGENPGYTGWWWYSPTAYAIKWAIIAAIFVIFVVFFGGGYLHAQHRLKKGLPLLAYHRWLVPRRQRAPYHSDDRHAFSFYRAQDGYAMNGYAAPPPAYNPEGDHVPAYSPPQGASKANPAQDYASVPPPGPPPSHSVGAPSYPPPVAASARGFQ